MALLTTIACGRKGRKVPRWRAAGLLALAVLGLAAPRAAAESSLSAENQVKAVFLFNFAQFAEWPASAFADARAPLIIGILGDDPFGTYLDELVKGEKIGEHPLGIRRYRAADDVAGCQILFISRSEAGHLDQIIPRLKGRSILTIGDADTFTRQGGMVRFVRESGKIRLRINLEAAKACGLTISSKIIRPATIVTAGKD